MPSWGGDDDCPFDPPTTESFNSLGIVPGTFWRLPGVNRSDHLYRENDHCCSRFKLVDGWLRSAGLQSEGPVGHGWARLAPSRALVTVVGSEVEVDPLIFLHPPEAGCSECDLARRSIGRYRPEIGS
mgnify:CR=1 FL=1